MYDREGEIRAYEDARRMMREYISQRSDIVSCWEYGRMTHPGVSDLDIIAVVSDTPVTDISDFLSNSSLPKTVVDVMAHANIIVVNEQSQEGIFYWDNISVRNLLTGEPNYRSPSPVDNSIRLLAMFVDWTFERIYRVTAYHLRGSKDARKTLGDLKSFCFCVDNFVAVGGGTVPGFANLRAQLMQVREKWPAINPAAQEATIHSLAADFFDFLPLFYEQVFAFLNEHPHYKAVTMRGGGETWLTFPGGMRWVFVDRLRVGWFSQDGVPHVQVPRCLLRHFAVYCRPDRPLSQRLSQAFSIDPCTVVSPAGDSYEAFLESRIAFCNDWYDFLLANSFGYGLYKFGWFLPSANRHAFVTWKEEQLQSS